MNLAEARDRIRLWPHLNAFISVSDEEGEGTVVAVKDLVDVRGMVTTAGGIILPNVPATEDAPVVRSIREAGCVVIGKTNLHEFAYGVTPASLCGVAGFKPAFGSIDISGVIPLSRSLDTLGPMGPNIAAVATAYSMMSGEDVPLDALTAPQLAVPAGWVTDLDRPTSEAWSKVSKGLPEIEFVDRSRLFEVGLTILLAEAAEYHRRWAAESPEKYGADVLRLIRRGLEIPSGEYLQALEERMQLQVEAQRAMEAIDALVLPATAIVAPPVDAGPEVREPLSRFTRPFNTTHQPVAVLPAPLPLGLPVGIQVAGRTNAGTLRAAAWLEGQWRSLG
ncbi:MAG: hypothetical protein AUI15_01540 [Actinobacteria bacterium 13_2_20CM_2_66_6]|nr:MAG: hypothetical protein AUI15_01540 [Actinobacteria bacterium 13_2_20CM_2_66_6]